MSGSYEIFLESMSDGNVVPTGLSFEAEDSARNYCKKLNFTFDSSGVKWKYFYCKVEYTK